jgi:GNAT superfamily N-acetyltransferase
MRIEAVDYAHPDALRLVEEVQQVYVERYGGTDDTPLEAAMFTPPGGSFFVGYDAGLGHDVAVATGAWRHSGVDRLGSTATAEVKRMYVVPAAQRRGLARVMLAHLEATAAAAGHDVMVLETGSEQPEAIALYLSSGYEPVPGFGHYRDSPSSRCFGKRLTSPHGMSVVSPTVGGVDVDGDER